MHPAKRTIKYLKHQLIGRNSKGFGIHSPSLFYLVTEVINDFTPFYCYNAIERQRQFLLKNKAYIEVSDFGAGSRIFKDSNRQVGAIAKHSLTSPKQAQLLFRIANYLQAKNILELGTSFGISTAYFASISKNNKIISLEGCPETAGIAKQTIKNLKLANTEIKVGEFDSNLTKALNELNTVDLIYFDGNHSTEATLKYFETCLPFTHNNTVFIFDDIHLNVGMEKAWEKIKNNPKVACSLDLFHLGIVFFKDQLSKEHHLIRFI